jgi:hypothetical protein
MVLRAFLRLPWREQALVVEAVARLATLPVALRVRGVRRVLPGARRKMSPSASESGTTRTAQLVESVGLALPWRTTCLHRALVTAALLRRRGRPCDVTIGVRRLDGGIAAHAWVGDGGATAADYLPLATFEPHGPSAAR